MERSKAHEPEKLTRYAFGELKEKEKESMERHLKACVPCREFLSFVREFNDELRKAKPQEPLPGEACPDPALLVALRENEADNETAAHIRVHMLYCENCRKDYEALNMLQPNTIEVVLRAAGSLIEIFRPPEMVHWESPLAKVAVRGEIVPSAPFRMSQMLSDDERNKSRITVQVEAGLEPQHVRLFVEGENVLPDWKWKVSLVDGNEEEWAGMPIDKQKIPVSSGIPFGLYTLEIRKGEQSLGAFKFTVEDMSSDEALEKGREYIESEDYFRALTILRDALQRDPKNESLAQELKRAQELQAEKEAEGEDEEEDEEETESA